MGVEDPTVKVDHRDGNTLDNRRENLRVATAAQNVRNARKKRSATTSRYKGVFFTRGRKGRSLSKPWQAQIRRGGKNRYLGCFETAEAAALAYDTAARETFGEFACLNFPRDGERSALTPATA